MERKNHVTDAFVRTGCYSINTVLCWIDSQEFQPNDLLLFSTFIGRAIGAAAAHPPLLSASRPLSVGVNLGVLCEQCRYLLSI